MGDSPKSIERQKWADEARPPPHQGPNNLPITALEWLHLSTNDHLRKLLSDVNQPLGCDYEDNIATHKNHLADGVDLLHHLMQMTFSEMLVAKIHPMQA